MLRRRRKGQAAVETAFSIPVFAVLFLIGFQLYALTWTAQSLHVRSRYKALSEVDHRPCVGRGYSGGSIGRGEHSYTETLTVQRDNDLLSGSGTGRAMTNRSYIVCR